MKRQCFLVLFLIFFISIGDAFANHPKAVNGFLDLTTWDFSEPLPLAGEWNFEHGKFTKTDFTQTQNVPEGWTKSEKSPFGIASYQLTLLFLKPSLENAHRKIGFEIPYMLTSYQLYINGHKVASNGKIAEKEEDYIPEYREQVFYHDLTEEKTEIVLQVANFKYIEGGMVRPILLGTGKQIASKTLSNFGIYVLLASIIGFMAIYHLILGALRKNWATLIFSLFCVSIIWRLLLGSRELYSYLQVLSLSWDSQYRLVSIIFYTSNLILLYYFYFLFPSSFKKKIVTLLLFIVGFFVLSAVFTEPSVFLKIKPIYNNIVSNLLFLHIFGSLILSIFRKEDYAKLNMFGFFFIFISGLHDPLVSAGLLPNSSYTYSSAIFIFLLVQSVIISIQFNQDFLISKSQAKKLLEHQTELEIKNQELTKLNQVKDQFLANTTHELRTPLHGIIGLTESLFDQVKEALPHQVSNVSSIIASGRRLSHLINDILDASSLKHKEIQLQLKPLNLRLIVDVTMTISASLVHQKSLELTNQIPPSTCVLADENRLQQILQNLIGNAIKFTETKVSSETKVSGKIEVSAIEKGEIIEITVSDTGPGIPQEDQERIFHSFEQLQGSSTRLQGGTGLGLSITREFVKLHGGKIWVDSQVGQGAKFTFTLPKSQEKPVNETTLAHERNGASSIAEIIDTNSIETSLQSVDRENGDFLILVVDDEIVNLQIVCNHLKPFNYSIMTATSGKEVLEQIHILEQRNQKPSLILLDVMMPKMDGFEVCQKIREVYPLHDLPVIFLTARNQVTDLIQGFDAGGNDYLTKPFSKNELFARTQTQLLLKVSRDRSSELRDYMGQLVQFDSEQALVKAAYEKFCNDPLVYQAAFYFDKKLLKSTDSSFPEVPPSMEEKREFFEKQGKKRILYLKVFEQYLLAAVFPEITQFESLESGGSLTSIWLRNLVFQAELCKKQIQELSFNPKITPWLSKIYSEKDDIAYIQARGNYTEVFYNNGTTEDLNIQMNKIALLGEVVSDEIIRIHKSYMVNSKLIRSIEKDSKGRRKVLVKEISINVNSKLALQKLEEHRPDIY